MEEILSTIITFLSGGIFGGIIVYFFKALYEHYLALTRTIEAIRIAEFNKAAAIFHAEFADVLFYLRQNIERGIGEKKLIFEIINTRELTRYEKAVILFEPFIDNAKLVDFRDTWKNYKEYMKATENKWADSAKPADTEWAKHFAISSDEGLNINQKYLDHINCLLEYAKRK